MAGMSLKNRTEPPEKIRRPDPPSLQDALLAAMDARVCLLGDSGLILRDFSANPSLAGKNIFSLARPDASGAKTWDPAFLAGLTEPVRVGAAFLSGPTQPCVLTFSPLRDSAGKHFLLLIRAAGPASDGKARAGHRDNLTGLCSPSRFHLILEQEAERARAENASLGILYCDLNNFRRINEQYGYLTGDALLARIADCLTVVLRGETRFACRYEGDDFVLLVPGADSASLEDIARDLDRRVRRVSREAVSTRIGLTLILPGQAPVTRIQLAKRACGKAKIAQNPFLWSGE
jgi:diguanylate cyclase (GGDEF)-like protein